MAGLWDSSTPKLSSGEKDGRDFTAFVYYNGRGVDNADASYLGWKYSDCSLDDTKKIWTCSQFTSYAKGETLDIEFYASMVPGDFENSYRKTSIVSGAEDGAYTLTPLAAAVLAVIASLAF